MAATRSTTGHRPAKLIAVEIAVACRTPNGLDGRSDQRTRGSNRRTDRLQPRGDPSTDSMFLGNARAEAKATALAGVLVGQIKLASKQTRRDLSRPLDSKTWRSTHETGSNKR